MRHRWCITSSLAACGLAERHVVLRWVGYVCREREGSGEEGKGEERREMDGRGRGMESGRG